MVAIAELELVETEVPLYFTYIDIVAKAEDRFIIAGYASFDEIDRQGEKISLKALDEAFKRMMKIPERRNLIFHHTNIQVGRILPSYKDSRGKIWRSGVDERGLFIVAELFRDIAKGRELVRNMERGHYLAFSIGGQALKRRTSCDGNVCWSEIVKLDLHEVTSCERPVNPASRAFILKAEEPFMDIVSLPSTNNLIRDPGKQPHEEKPMSEEKTDVNPDEVQVEKSDAQVILEAVNELKTLFTESLKAKKKPEEEEEEEEKKKAKKKPDEEEEEEKKKMLTKDDVKSLFDEWLSAKMDELQAAVKPDEEEEDEDKAKKPKYYYYYKKPKKEDFRDEAEYAKAEQEFEKLKGELRKEIEAEMGEVITKTPQVSGTAPQAVDLDQLFKHADEAIDLRDLLEKEGIDL